MVKKLSCVSCGSFKRFPHTFTSMSLPHPLQALGPSAPEPYYRFLLEKGFELIMLTSFSCGILVVPICLLDVGSYYFFLCLLS